MPGVAASFGTDVEVREGVVVVVHLNSVRSAEDTVRFVVAAD